MTDTARTEERKYEFQAEIQQLLDILIHSVYTSKDIFIRELVSNAADALEKVRFAKARGRAVHEPELAEEIRITSREEDGRKVLTICDTGIGMTEEELRVNLGTIAHSGASAFLESLKKEGESAQVNLIGQFGVGFYSVFMVAEKVAVTSRSAVPNAEAVTWTSTGSGGYEITTAAGRDDRRGTRVDVFLKPDEERFAELDGIRAAIRKYSNFVPFPIVVGEDQVNRVTALWREQPSRVAEEQYREFFEYLTFEGNEPLLRLHLQVDVPLQFSALLYVPSTDTEIIGFGEREPSLQLYVKRVLIDPANKDLLPKYLRFVTGVVESEDLPLNVSRETLQENRIVLKIRDTITRKLLDLFLDVAKEDSEKYAKLWKTFGRILKEGYGDFAHREKLYELLRFNSSAMATGESLTSLAEAVERLPEAQKAIYYLSGPSRQALERDPRLELFRKKGIEVLYLYEIADEFVLAGLGKYKDKPLRSADQIHPEELSALGVHVESRELEAEAAESAAAIAPLIARFKEVLGERVLDVRASERLVDSPACLVAQDGVSGHMDKVLRLIHRETDLPKRILELNPKHALIRSLARIFEKDPVDAFIGRACEQLFEGAMLADGYLSDPHELVERMHGILEDAAVLRAERARSEG